MKHQKVKILFDCILFSIFLFGLALASNPNSGNVIYYNAPKVSSIQEFTKNQGGW